MLAFYRVDLPLLAPPLDLLSAARAIAANREGAWINDESDERFWTMEAKEAIEEARRNLYETLRIGELTAYVQAPNEAGLRVVPADYWRDDNHYAREQRLSARLFGSRGSVVPSDVEGQPLLLLRADVESFVLRAKGADHSPSRVSGTDRRGERTKFVYPLCRFGDEFTTVDVVSALRRTTGTLGDHPDSSRPRLKLHAALVAGVLQAYIHREGSSDFHRIPLQHWHARPRNAARLAPKVNWPVDTVPEPLVGGALVFREDDLSSWLSGLTKPAAVVRRGGPKPIFDAMAYEAEAVRQLWEEGGYNEGWTRPMLADGMAQWCDLHWERTPGKTWQDQHLRLAEEAFRAEKAAI